MTINLKIYILALQFYLYHQYEHSHMECSFSNLGKGR